MPKLFGLQNRRQTPAPSIPPRAQPLEVNRLDHQIHLQNGSTSVLELSQQRVQLSKRNPPLSPFARVEELTRELSEIRQETQFYRQSFGNLQKLRETGYDIYQQIFLLLHLDLDPDNLYRLMLQLHHALEDSVRCEAKAEKAWMGFWGIESNGEKFGGVI